MGRFISSDTIVQDYTDPQTLNRFSYARNNPLLYTDPSGHFFLVDDILIGAAIGAAIGATSSAITGGDIGMGALTGAISGGIFGGAGWAISQYGFNITNSLAQTGIHMAAGAASGAANASVMGGDIGMGAAIGGLSAGGAKYAGGLLSDNFASQFAGRTVIGGVIGGTAAEIYGGNFGEGFKNGAVNSSIGMLANDTWHKNQEKAYAALKKMYSGAKTAVTKGYEGGKTALASAKDSVAGMATNGPTEARATLALAATPMVAAGASVTGPYALSYALMNPQGVVDFAEALAPGPPGPNNWGRIFGGIDFLQSINGK